MAARTSATSWIRVSLVALAFALSERASHALQPGFTSVGDLSGAVIFRYVSGISADGTTVIGLSDTATTREAFKWTRGGGLVGLGDLPGGVLDSSPSGVSGDGSVVTGVGTNDHGRHAFRWTATHLINAIDPPGSLVDSTAFGISQNGQVIFGAAGCEGFRWSLATGTMNTGIGSGDFCVSWTGGTNADGSVVAGTAVNYPSGEPRAFRWSTANGLVLLGDLPGGTARSQSLAISTDGSVVVGASSSANGTEAFVWREEIGMVGLGDLPGGDFSSEAHGVSADGKIVVGAGYAGGRDGSVQQAFFWDAHGMRDLKAVLQNEYGLSIPAGWRLQDAYVSGDGSAFAGSGQDPTGRYTGWYAVIPEPSSAMLAISMMTLLSLRYRKMRFDLKNF